LSNLISLFWLGNSEILKKIVEKWGSKLDHLVRYPILFPWRARADLVRGRVSTTNVVCGRVSSHIAAGLPPLSFGTVIVGCLFSDFDWTSWYRGASLKMITTQGVVRTASSSTLLP